MNAQYQKQQLISALQYIALSLKTVQQDVSLLAEIIGKDDFQTNILTEIKTARKAVAKILSMIDSLNGGEL